MDSNYEYPGRLDMFEHLKHISMIVEKKKVLYNSFDPVELNGSNGVGLIP